MKREEETTYPCYKPVRKTKKHIVEEAKRFSFLYPSEGKEMFFIYGAEWADKTMLDRACEWLKDGGYFVNSNETIEDFRKAMEGGADDVR